MAIKGCLCLFASNKEAKKVNLNKNKNDQDELFRRNSTNNQDPF